MKSWKKQLKKEFDAVVPELKDEIKNAPIAISQENKEIYHDKNLKKGRIGILSSLSAVLTVAIIFIVLGVLGVFNPIQNNDNFVFVLEINPAVTFVTDTQGHVQRVYSLNSDADVILSNEDVLIKLKNKPLSEAIVTYTDYAAKLGYLDMNKLGGAVRLSSNIETDETLFNETSYSLQTYFQTRGIYSLVVEDLVPVEKLSERVGLSDINNVEDIANLLKNNPVFYGERQIKDVDDFEPLYNSYIIGTQLFELIHEKLINQVDLIVSNAEMLLQLTLLNSQIMAHDDNPVKYPIIQLGGDYWSVSQLAETNYTPEFAKLMCEMEELLNVYENDFGVCLKNMYELTSATNIYSSLQGSDLEELLRTLTSDSFLSATTSFLGILENIGVDISQYSLLLNEMPKNFEEYLSKLQITENLLFDSKIEQYSDIYNQSRAEISSETYKDFVREIEQEYGSLVDYWDKSQL